MEVLVFKTNIETRLNLDRMEPIFNNHPNIKVWSIDTEDVDNVLRIEADESLSEKEVIQLIQPIGVQCEVLNY